MNSMTHNGEIPMNPRIRILVLLLATAAFSAHDALAGRGGGGGFHGGGGGFHGGESFGMGRSFGDVGSHGGASFGNINRSDFGRVPSYNAPRTFTMPSTLPRTSIPSQFTRPNYAPRTWSSFGPATGVHPTTRSWSNVRPGNVPYRGNWGYGHNWYHGPWHGHWDHPWRRWPYGWFGAGAAWGLSFGTPWTWGYWPYYNPYYVAPIIVGGGATIDYSQPIATYADYGAGADQTQADQDSQLLDQARGAFYQGDYSGALSLVDQAIAKEPGDLAAHEFRSLVCFAMKKYRDAASAAYAVLSVGPGWDWTTLSGFYPNVSVYTEQLRALEQYVASHPDAGDARFLLAYQYLCCGYTDAAAKQLKEAVRIDPKDRLSSQLLAALTSTEPAETPKPNAPAKPVDAASLVGDWKVQQPDGSTIALKLTGDSNYTWLYTRDGKTQTHQGAYTLADNLLILKENDKPVMVGQVSLVGGRLNFKLANDNPSDPGLTFSK